jgi:hypothetical protein
VIAPVPILGPSESFVTVIVSLFELFTLKALSYANTVII